MKRGTHFLWPDPWYSTWLPSLERSTEDRLEEPRLEPQLDTLPAAIDGNRVRGYGTFQFWKGQPSIYMHKRAHPNCCTVWISSIGHTYRQLTLFKIARIWKCPVYVLGWKVYHYQNQELSRCYPPEEVLGLPFDSAFGQRELCYIVHSQRNALSP